MLAHVPQHASWQVRFYVTVKLVLGNSLTARKQASLLRVAGIMSLPPKKRTWPGDPDDAGAHQVCIREMPMGFSASTGQGAWSDEHEGQSWCICIW